MERSYRSTFLKQKTDIYAHAHTAMLKIDQGHITLRKSLRYSQETEAWEGVIF